MLHLVEFLNEVKLNELEPILLKTTIPTVLMGIRYDHRLVVDIISGSVDAVHRRKGVSISFYCESRMKSKVLPVKKGQIR